MDYDTALKYIDSFINFEKIPRYDYSSSFNLERMHFFLRELGDPHLALKAIHVAGSKGKGSTCAIIAHILRQAGYRVGLYTSPHLLDPRERIRILEPESGKPQDFDGMISQDRITQLIKNIMPHAEKFRDHEILGRLSFFEILTSCAFLYFKEENVDFAVLETGMGGRLDATNVISPIVCGITNISFEHTDKLGDSLESIAKEKSGIIKCQGFARLNSRQMELEPGTVVISAPQKKEALNILAEKCREERAILYEIGKKIRFSITASDSEGTLFNLDGPGYSYSDLWINLIGLHQVENAVLGISIVSVINKGADRIPEAVIREGLKNVYWPGRLDVLRKSPYLILDGAHNVASIKGALFSIKTLFRYKRLISIFGAAKDKDIRGMSMELDRFSDTVILTKSNYSRAEEPYSLKNNFYKSQIIVTDCVGAAIEEALKIADREDLILVVGSLYIVGEAINFVKNEDFKAGSDGY